MGRITGAFLLKNYENMYGENPLDKIILFREVTLSGSSGSVNLFGAIKRNTTLSYWLLKQATTNSTTGILTVTAAVAGAADTVTAMIVANVDDIAAAGEV